MEQHSKQEMQKQIDKIVSTCESHFAFEEGILEIRHYPKISEHIEIHKKLLSKAIKLKRLMNVVRYVQRPFLISC